MKRKEIAEETLRIQRQGFYGYKGRRVEIATAKSNPRKIAS
ncbi:hypothetical protein [Paenibacillus alvei]